MKNLLNILLAGIFVISFSNYSVAQKTEKELKKELNEKSVKKARKEAKQLEKDGYYIAIGALPAEIQLEKAWMKQLEEDEDGYPKYIVATGISVAETQAAAKIQATEVAKLELAGKISSDIAALMETNIANEQLSNTEAASVTKTVAAAKSIIAQELGRVITLIEMYKTIDENTEANVRLAYDSKTAKDAAKKVIRQRLEEETELMQDKLDKLMNF